MEVGVALVFFVFYKDCVCSFWGCVLLTKFNESGLKSLFRAIFSEKG